MNSPLRRGAATRSSLLPDPSLSSDCRLICNPEWAECSADEKLLELRMCDLGVSIAGHRARAAHRGGQYRARGARPGVPAALLAVRRVVHARRRPGRRHPVLPRASAAREAGARADARSRRRRSRVVPAHPAARSRPRHRQRLSAPPAADAAAAVRHCRRRPIPSTTRPSRTARASSSISITGTRRAIRTRTSPKPSRCGSIRSRCGRRATQAGRRERKLEYMDRLMRELLRRSARRVTSKRQIDPLSRLRKTLGEHYRTEA